MLSHENILPHLVVRKKYLTKVVYFMCNDVVSPLLTAVFAIDINDSKTAHVVC